MLNLNRHKKKNVNEYNDKKYHKDYNYPPKITPKNHKNVEVKILH